MAMFSGIVEATSVVLESQTSLGLIRVSLQKPIHFDDLKTGDSIACNGVCLTLESFDSQKMIFALALETLKVLKLANSASELTGQSWNLERSLRFGDRIHGHLVTGHVDSLGQVELSQADGESWLMDIRVETTVLPYIWKKGSLTIHGVSLTVNDIRDAVVSVCLIPETQKRTNLSSKKKGDFVNIEPDSMAKAVIHAQELQRKMKS